MARRRATVQQLAPVLAVAVHIVWLGYFSCPPSAFFEPPAREKAVSFLMDPRIKMRFDHSSDSPYEGLLDLASATGARINISRGGDWFPHDGPWKKIVTIAGERNRVLAAFAHVLPPTRSDNAFVTVLLPISIDGNVIGAGGRAISEMQDETGAVIIIKRATACRWREVKIKGSNAEVNAAISWILDNQDDDYVKENRALSDSTRISGMDSETEIFFELKADQSRYLIGKGGATARSIASEFHVRLIFDNASLWKMTGLLGDVHAAHHYISTYVLPVLAKRT
eukprot:TRINITY_DN77393_c0_g1_i1.p1 TRINITY_DN77393_c0_g1~~TRINITY_DN77393_c0_g1_i1.p1  ORF type:complete len:282 (+),score=39.90 TRINITY_DN77393_c0_g1_i1:64-909(+)